MLEKPSASKRMEAGVNIFALDENLRVIEAT
jgi:hypothetical protein